MFLETQCPVPKFGFSELGFSPIWHQKISSQIGKEPTIESEKCFDS
jgi:hypothetical protein